MCALLRGAAFPGAVQAGCAKAACECLIVTVWYGHGGSSNLLQLGCEQCAGTQFQVARNVFFARREDNEIVVADSLPVYGLLITYPTQANILWRLYETLLGRGVQCQLPKMYVSRLWKFTFLLETWTAQQRLLELWSPVYPRWWAQQWAWCWNCLQLYGELQLLRWKVNLTWGRAEWFARRNDSLSICKLLEQTAVSMCPSIRYVPAAPRRILFLHISAPFLWAGGGRPVLSVLERDAQPEIFCSQPSLTQTGGS